MASNDYQVTGMTCGHCEMSIREEVSEIPGVQDIQVSAQTGKLNVTADKFSKSAQEKIEAAGGSVTAVTAK